MVKLPATRKLFLDLLACLGPQILLKLLECYLAVAIRVESLKHVVIHEELLACALLKAKRAEGALELANGQRAVLVKVKHLEDLTHVDLGMALDRLLPFLAIKLPAGVELRLDLRARRRIQVLLELSQRNATVAVGVEGVEHRLIDCHLLTGALLEAKRTEGTLELAQIEEAVAVAVELLEDLRQIPAVAHWQRVEEALASVHEAARILVSGARVTEGGDSRITDGAGL
mmetsp:Transcript_26707/g.53652  ORF Transcript_26707/g.53652 Transcript_26707/m.53652 type:complete len:229 (+) Transcript_26707:803-1489(+)